METGGIARIIGKLFKRERGGANSLSPVLLPSPAPEDPKVLEQIAQWEANQKKAKERPLGPLLQKNKDIVYSFAQAHDLETEVWDGVFC